MTPTEAVSAVTPSASASSDTVSVPTNLVVVESVPENTATESAPAEQSSPEVVEESGRKTNAEDTSVAIASAFALPVALTPGVLRKTVGRGRAIAEDSRHGEFDTAEEKVMRLAGS